MRQYETMVLLSPDLEEEAVDERIANFEKQITDTEPGVRGDTATNVTKGARIDSGYEIQVPLFINEGDTIKIDTRTGEYSERVRKS